MSTYEFEGRVPKIGREVYIPLQPMSSGSSPWAMVVSWVPEPGSVATMGRSSSGGGRASRITV